jgi:hypothetical protein
MGRAQLMAIQDAVLEMRARELESERARSTHAVTAAMFRRKTGKADTIAICQVVFSF